jgi:hypothetical protein
MPCHTTVAYEDPDWEKSLDADAVRQCAGQGIYLANTCTLPRPGPHAAKKLPADRVLVFGDQTQFIEHHAPARVRQTKR